MILSDEQLSNIRERIADKDANGHPRHSLFPWIYQFDDEGSSMGWIEGARGSDYRYDTIADIRGDSGLQQLNAELIALAVNSLPGLLDTIDALHRERDEAVAGAYLAAAEYCKKHADNEEKRGPSPKGLFDSEVIWEEHERWMRTYIFQFRSMAKDIIALTHAAAQAALAAYNVMVHKQGFDAGFEGAERAAFERERKYMAEKDATIAALQAELAAAKRDGAICHCEKCSLERIDAAGGGQ